MITASDARMIEHTDALKFIKKIETEFELKLSSTGSRMTIKIDFPGESTEHALIAYFRDKGFNCSINSVDDDDTGNYDHWEIELEW